jgi:hypothetical protein
MQRTDFGWTGGRARELPLPEPARRMARIAHEQQNMTSGCCRAQDALPPALIDGVTGRGRPRR